MQKATFGGGCFWCTEAIFFSLKGVQKISPGYMGGSLEMPSYEQICTGTTGHAEVIQFEYDESAVSFEELLLVFFKTHNPTTLNQQGADLGSQYRSVIFYHDLQQKEKAIAIIQQLEEEVIFKNKIVTEISPAESFYQAEKYHHDYYLNNQKQPYCQAVIQPKLAAFAATFKDKIKKELL